MGSRSSCRQRAAAKERGLQRRDCDTPHECRAVCVYVCLCVCVVPPALLYYAVRSLRSPGASTLPQVSPHGNSDRRFSLPTPGRLSSFPLHSLPRNGSLCVFVCVCVCDAYVYVRAFACL